MPKIVAELSELSIKRLRHGIGTGAKNPSLKGKPIKAMHAVGGVKGLYLQCLPPKGKEKVGSRQWIYRATVGDKLRNVGLGNYPSVPTKSARERAREMLEGIADGIDPVHEKKTKIALLKSIQAKEITFEDYTKQKFIPTKTKTYKSPQQVRRLKQLLDDYVFPHIGKMVFEDIRKQDIEKILEPIWETKNETARRVQNYIHSIIQRAISDDLREKGNCAVWKDNLEMSFPEREAVHTVKSHRAIEWKELPKFMKALNELDTPKGTRPEVSCMVFMILTVSRPQEARLVDWEEIDLKEKVWTQPKGKYKSKRMWQIPLCTTAIRILKAQPSYGTKKGRIFSSLNGSPLHDRYLSALPDALGFDAVAHGFRATFRTWGQKHQKQHNFSEEELELSLKHCETLGCRAAYARDQLLPERKKVIRIYETWAMKRRKS